VVGGVGDGVVVSVGFPFEEAVFLEPLEVLGDFEFILVERVLDVFQAVVEFIEEELEFIEIDFPLMERVVLWLRVLMVNYSKRESMSQRKAS